jgi:hypothetical protein
MLHEHRNVLVQGHISALKTSHKVIASRWSPAPARSRVLLYDVEVDIVDLNLHVSDAPVDPRVGLLGSRRHGRRQGVDFSPICQASRRPHADDLEALLRAGGEAQPSGGGRAAQSRSSSRSTCATSRGAGRCRHCRRCLTRRNKHKHETDSHKNTHTHTQTQRSIASEYKEDAQNVLTSLAIALSKRVGSQRLAWRVERIAHGIDVQKMQSLAQLYRKETRV